jgi:phosphoserine phosphatase
MNQEKEIIVFDIDKTLIHRNLHELIIEMWCAEHVHRRALVRIASCLHALCFIPFLKRRIEYLITAFIPERQLHALTLRILSGSDNVHEGLKRRIDRYKRYNYAVVLVSATPERVALPLAQALGVDVYASKSICGVLTRDLLAKKHKVYRTMEQQAQSIRTIYSDSHLDFWKPSKNFLVEHKTVTRVTA